jgi:HAD superfamily hydrolase (TIGR01490 family)
MFKGKKVTEIDAIFKKFFEEELKKAIYLESKKIIDEHIKDKDTVILISASLNNLLEYLKKYLGLDFLFATRLEIDDGVFTGKIEGEAVYSNNKIEIIKKFIQERNVVWKDVFVYTDHISDLELLEMVGHPKVINPDKFLRRIAKKKRWIVYDFR